MSGETEKAPSGWTVDTLKEYFDSILVEKDKAIQAALISAEKAVTKAENAAEKRFEGVNEFRRTLSDQATLFLPRTEYDAAHDNLVERVNDLQDRMNRNEGKGQGVSALAGWAVAGISLIITIVVAANAVFR